MADNLTNVPIQDGTEIQPAGLGQQGRAQAQHANFIVRMAADMFLATFQHSTIINKITSKRYNDVIAKKVGKYWSTGATIDIPIEYRMREASDGYTSDANTPRAKIITRFKRFTLDESAQQLLDIPMMENLFDFAGDIKGFMADNVMPELYRVMGTKVDQSATDRLNAAYQTVGTAGTEVSADDIDLWIEAMTQLQRIEAPGMDFASMQMMGNHQWVIVLPPTMDARLVKYAADKGNDNAVQHTERAWRRNVLEFQRIPYNNLPYYSTGTRALANANQPIQVSDAPPAAGARTMANSNQIKLKRFAYTGANLDYIEKGEIIKIAGVNQVHPRFRKDAGVQQQFVVLEKAFIASDGTVTVQISPEINDGDLKSSADTGGLDYSPWKNVTKYPAQNAAVTLMGDKDSNYEQAFITHPHAIEYCPMVLPLPNTAYFKYQTPPQPTHGSPNLLVTGEYNQGQIQDDYKYVMAWATGAVDMRYCIRVLGKKIS